MVLSVVEPAADSCALEHLGAVVAVQLEVGDDEADTVSAIGAARICFSLDGEKQSCIEGTSEAWFSAVKAGRHSVVATAILDGRLLASSAVVNFEVASTTMQCSSSTMFPVSEVGRRAFSSIEAARHGGASLEVRWPRPGDVVYSSRIVVSASLARPTEVDEERSMEPLTGLVCVHALQRKSNKALEHCILVEDSEFIELLLPPEWLDEDESADVGIYLRYSADDGHHSFIRSVPIEIRVRAKRSEPPLEEGWILSRPALDLASLPACLVLCHWDEDLYWLEQQPFPAVVYEKQPQWRDSPTAHSTPRNTANEATAYLQFIVDYYDRGLPERMIFLHSHRYAYHQPDLLNILNDLSLKSEYCNLNSAVWGTKEDPDRVPLYVENRDWLEKHLGPLPTLLLDRCCAQFLVSRERVLARPLAFYQEALRHALYDVEEAHLEGHKEPNRQMGLLFEWVWHYVFGEPAVAPELTKFTENVENLHLFYPRGKPKCLDDDDDRQHQQEQQQQQQQQQHTRRRR